MSEMNDKSDELAIKSLSISDYSLVDIGVNLTDDLFKPDLEDVLQRAKSSGM